MTVLDDAITGTKDSLFSGAKKLAAKASSLVVGQSTEEKEAQRQTRRQLSKITNQLDLTRTIITNNSQTIMELAKGDSRLSTLLKDISDPKALAIQQKIVKGQEVNTKEAAEVISNLEKVTGALESVGVALEVDLDQVVGKFSNLILDSEQDLESRRALVTELTDLTTKQQVDSAAIPELKKLMEQQINFTAKETQQVTALLNQLKTDTTNKKIVGTLREMQQQNETLILTQEELNSTLARTTASGKSVGDVFKTEGLAKNVRTGLFQSILGALGLGSLIPLLGDVDPLDLLKGGFKGGGKLLKGAATLFKKLPGSGKLIGGVAALGGGLLGKFKGAGGGLLEGGGKLASKAVGATGEAISAVPGFLGKGAGALGSLAKGATKLLGKLALPLAIIMGALDFFEGFSNAAEIAGIDDPSKLSLGRKTIAGIASMISGLTFGLIDAKDLFQTLDKGIDFLIGKDGILSKIGNYFSNMFTRVSKVFSNFFGGAKDIFANLGGGMKEFGKSMIDKIVNGFGVVVDFLFGENGLISFETLKKAASAAISALPGGSVLMKFFGKTEEQDAADKAAGKTESVLDKAVGGVKGVFGFGSSEEKSPTVVQPASAMESNITPQGTLASATAREVQMKREQAIASRPAAAVSPTVIPAPNKGSAGTIKRTNVDDYGVAFMNSTVFDN